MGYDTEHYAATVFNPSQNGPTDVTVVNYDSGGMIRLGDSVVRVVSTRAGNRMNYTRLDTVEDWILENTDGGGIWAVTAAHASIDFPVSPTLTHVYLGDFNNPDTTLKVVQVINHPAYTGGGAVMGTIKGSH